MSNLKSINKITFRNGYTMDLPYKVTIDLDGDKDQLIIELLLKQIIKLKEEVHGQSKKRHRR